MRRFMLILFATSLVACQKPLASSSQDVIGPDLDHGGGPFAAMHRIVITIPEAPESLSSAVTASSPSDLSQKQNNIPKMTITRGESEDVARLDHVLSDTKSYLAGVTWKPVKPIVAETNEQARTYWLLGLNLSRTPDRSVYFLLRYPHELEMKTKKKIDRAEYVQLSCFDLSVARTDPNYYRPRHNDKDIPLPPPSPRPEAGDCEFASLIEAQTVSLLVLNHYDQIRHFKDAPQLDWKPIGIETQ